MTRYNYSDDEAMARALQSEYEKEYRRLSMQQHLRQSNTPDEVIIRPPMQVSVSRPKSARNLETGTSTNRKSLQSNDPPTQPDFVNENWGFSDHNPFPSAPVSSVEVWGFPDQEQPLPQKRQAKERSRSTDRNRKDRIPTEVEISQPLHSSDRPRKGIVPEEVEITLEDLRDKKSRSTSRYTSNADGNMANLHSSSPDLDRRSRDTRPSIRRSNSSDRNGIIDITSNQGNNRRQLQNSHGRNLNSSSRNLNISNHNPNSSSRNLNSSSRNLNSTEADRRQPRRANCSDATPRFIAASQNRPTLAIEDSTLGDEAFARELQETEVRETKAAPIGRPTPTGRPTVTRSRSNDLLMGNPASRNHNGHAATGGIVVTSTGRMLTDEELACRIAQEEQDAAFARSISANEQIRGVPVPQKKTFLGVCCRSVGRLISCLVSLCLLAIAVGLLVWYFGGQKNMPGFIPSPDIFKKEDPFYQNPDSSNRWRNDGNGVKVTLINALDESWNDFFYKAVDDWDKGTPDSLNIETKMGTPNSDCPSETGFIKVCNGDYGATSWRGINKVLLENGYIYASAARMNEFYFKGEDLFQRQYTMCHEIGHGFGLPHTDENFYNSDLGNCMDYTNNPKGNMQPSTMNFEFLAKLYGTFDGSYIPSGNATVESSASVSPAKNEGEAKPKPEEKPKHDGPPNPDDRKLLQAWALREEKRQKVIRMTEEIDILFDTGRFRNKFGNSRRLGWTNNADFDEVSVDLEDGYEVRYHLLLA